MQSNIGKRIAILTASFSFALLCIISRRHRPNTILAFENSNASTLLDGLRSRQPYFAEQEKAVEQMFLKVQDHSDTIDGIYRSARAHLVAKIANDLHIATDTESNDSLESELGIIDTYLKPNAENSSNRAMLLRKIRNLQTDIRGLQRSLRLEVESMTRLRIPSKNLEDVEDRSLRKAYWLQSNANHTSQQKNHWKDVAFSLLFHISQQPLNRSLQGAKNDSGTRFRQCNDILTVFGGKGRLNSASLEEKTTACWIIFAPEMTSITLNFEKLSLHGGSLEIFSGAKSIQLNSPQPEWSINPQTSKVLLCPENIVLILSQSYHSNGGLPEFDVSWVGSSKTSTILARAQMRRSSTTNVGSHSAGGVSADRLHGSLIISEGNLNRQDKVLSALLGAKEHSH